ncbi:MAG TPA: 4'-phosphopantetheinyl transferase superfamily protein [Planctomycetes bacterium]|nr:4'-phosphopantetheinyl transferase superfamily protein [Planctomycetota bacterium]
MREHAFHVRRVEECTVVFHDPFPGTQDEVHPIEVRAVREERDLEELAQSAQPEPGEDVAGRDGFGMRERDPVADRFGDLTEARGAGEVEAHRDDPRVLGGLDRNADHEVGLARGATQPHEQRGEVALGVFEEGGRERGPRPHRDAIGRARVGGGEFDRGRARGEFVDRASKGVPVGGRGTGSGCPAHGGKRRGRRSPVRGVRGGAPRRWEVRMEELSARRRRLRARFSRERSRSPGFRGSGPLRIPSMAVQGWREPPELRAEEFHLWWGRVVPQGPRDSARFARCLSSDEEARAARFHREVHARRFRARRTFLRRILAAYLGASPAELAFRTGEHGKPALDPDAGIEFNLSHTSDLVLVGVGRRVVGVDVERFRLKTSLERLAEQVLSPGELAGFLELAADRRLAAFFRIWTRKEAVLKVLGDGLSRDPRSFEVGFEEHGWGEVWAPDSPPPIGELGLLDLETEDPRACAACISAPGTDWSARVVTRVELG